MCSKCHKDVIKIFKEAVFLLDGGKPDGNKEGKEGGGAGGKDVS